MKFSAGFILLFTLPFTGCARGEVAEAAPQAASKARAREAVFSMQRLQETYRKAGSLEAKFQQEVFQASLARTKTSTGTLALQAPNRIHWEVNEPEPSLTVSNGKKLWYYTPGAGAAGQVVVRPASQIATQPLFRILMGSADLTKEFLVERQERIEGIVPGRAVTKVTLRPKRVKRWGDMERVTLTTESNYLISEVLIQGAAGNRTKITLQNQRLGTKLSPKLFDFSPPADAEIIQD